MIQYQQDFVTRMDYVCIDCSGSTGGCKGYWQKVKSLIDANQDANLVMWDNDASIWMRKDVLSNIQKNKGHGGTSPSSFANIIPDNCKVAIITDGQVGPGEVDRCDNIIKGKKFTQMNVYFVGNESQMNLGISAPFTRNSNYNIYVNDKLLAGGDSAVVIDLKKYYNNPDLFLQECEDLYKQVVMQNLGKSNQDLRNQLLELQKNLFGFLSTQNSKGVDFEKLRKVLTTGNFDASVKVLIGIINQSNDSNTPAKRVEHIINNCIQQCNGSKDFSFNVLQPGRLSRASNIASPKTEELPTESSRGDFECPITLDDAMPAFLIAVGDPVLKDCEKGYLDFLMNMPLGILGNKDLVTKVKARFDSVIGLDAVKMIFNGNQKSPFTRRDLSSVVVFGNDKTHYKANTYALADIFFGNKLVGNQTLWLAALYLILKDVERVKDSDGFNYFKKYLIAQLTSQRTNITLTGLPMDPFIKTPIDIGFWYCLNSPYINPKIYGLPDLNNRLRSFGDVSYSMLELLEVVNPGGFVMAPGGKDAISHLLKMYKTFNWMMDQCKADRQGFSNTIRTLYQNYVTVNGTLVMLDGPCDTPRMVPEFNNLLPVEIYALSKLVDPSKRTFDINIPVMITLQQLPKAIIEYTYPTTLSIDDFNYDTKICKKTLRPFTLDPKTKVEWLMASEKKYGPVKGQLSCYNYFIQYVTDKGKYPTKDEFVLYLSSRQANSDSNRKSTLPKFVLRFVDNVFNSYEEVLGAGFKDVNSSDFIVITKNSRDSKHRWEIENN